MAVSQHRLWVQKKWAGPLFQSAALPALRTAIAEKLGRKYNLQLNADEIIVTYRLTQAAFAPFIAFLDEGGKITYNSAEHISIASLPGMKKAPSPCALLRKPMRWIPAASPTFRVPRAMLPPGVRIYCKLQRCV